MNNTENELDEDDILYEMHDLMDKYKFDEIIIIMNKYNKNINLRNFNNDDELIKHACETLNYEGIKFCVNNGTDIKYLSKACCYAFKHYNDNHDNVIEIIEYVIDIIISNNKTIHDLYHYSLTWNYYEIHKYLLENHYDKINLSWFEDSIYIACNFGNYDLIKNCFESNYYKDIVTSNIVNKCLEGIFSLHCYLDKDLFNLIHYLVVEMKAILNDENKMIKINKLVEEYNSMSDFYKLGIYIRKI